MIRDVAHYFRYGWRIGKAYIIYCLLVELLEAGGFIAGIILPELIIDELFVGSRVDSAVRYIAILVGALFLSSVGAAAAKYFAERARDRMYSRYSLSIAQESMRKDLKSLESPKYHDMREKALRCMTGEYGFAGINLVAIFMLGRLLRLGGIVAVITQLHVHVVVAFFVLVALNILVDARLKTANIDLDHSATPIRRRLDYLKDLPPDRGFAKEIRLNVLAEWVLEKLGRQFDLLRANSEKRNRNTRRLSSFDNLMSVAQQVITYVYLIGQTLAGSVSIGSFVMFVRATASFNATVTELFRDITRIAHSSMYFGPFRELMEQSRGMRDSGGISARGIDARNCTIEFDHVSFRYPGQERWAIRDVSLEIRPGERVSIVGENGAGKTTFVKLLTRLYDPDEGRILVGGVDITRYRYDEYMRLFSVAFQDYKLFAASIRENVAFPTDGDLPSRSDGGEDPVWKAVRQAGIGRWVSGLKGGLETQIYKTFDENGVEPSGGEGQKIAIARALFRNGSIIVLDEPTAALDPRSEYQIYSNLDDLIEARTMIFVSHRLASSRFCDRIIVFRDGRVIETGDHAALMAHAGVYAELFSMQAQHYT